MHVSASKIGSPRIDDYLKMPPGTRQAYYKSEVFINPSPSVFAMAAVSSPPPPPPPIDTNPRSSISKSFSKTLMRMKKIEATKTCHTTTTINSVSDLPSWRDHYVAATSTTSHRGASLTRVPSEEEAYRGYPAASDINGYKNSKRIAAATKYLDEFEDSALQTSASSSSRFHAHTMRGGGGGAGGLFTEEIREAEEAAEETLETRSRQRGKKQQQKNYIDQCIADQCGDASQTNQLNNIQSELMKSSQCYDLLSDNHLLHRNQHLST